MSQAMNHAVVSDVTAREPVVQTKSDEPLAAARRPAIRAAVVLAAAVTLTILGMTLAYSFVRVLES